MPPQHLSAEKSGHVSAPQDLVYSLLKSNTGHSCSEWPRLGALEAALQSEGWKGDFDAEIYKYTGALDGAYADVGHHSGVEPQGTLCSPTRRNDVIQLHRGSS